MKLSFVPQGGLRDAFGSERLSFELPEGATLRELLDRIAIDFSEGLPPELWNREKGRFRGPIVLSSGGHVLRGPGTPLYDGQEVSAQAVLVGG